MDRGEGRAVDEHRSDRVEEDLERAEECLAQDRVEEERFHGGGKVGVKARHAERLVVGEMVGL